MAEKKRPARINVHPAVMAGIEKHAYSNLEAEVGGVFYGSISGKNTVISGSVPASKASAEQMTLTFTHEVWEDIYREGEKNFPGEQIVGWYHTHPSFGLFLSEYDQFIQKNFFANSGQLALVIDPIAGNMGWFELKKNEINMFYEEPTKTGPKPRLADAQKPQNNKSMMLAIGAAVVSASITWGISAALAAPDLRQRLNEVTMVLNATQQSLYEAQTQLGETDRGLSFLYTVRTGDTKASIAKMFYGDAKEVATLVADNPNLKSAEPQVGSTVLIVGALGMNRITPPAPEAPATKDSTDKPKAPVTKDSTDKPKTKVTKDATDSSPAVSGDTSKDTK